MILLGHMTTPLPVRVRRFIFVSIFVTISLIGLFILMCSFPDSDLPPYPPDTIFQRISTFVCLIGSWPIIILAILLHRDPPAVLWLPLWLATGMFWAFILELCFVVKGRMWPNKSPEPTGNDASV